MAQRTVTIASKGKLMNRPKAATTTRKIGSTQSRGTRLPMVLPEKVGTVETTISAMHNT